MTVFKRSVGVAMAAALLASSVAVAQVAPLPAGKPAGTKEAALVGLPVLILGLAVVGAIVAIAVSSSGNDNTPTTPTTSTSGTGA